MAEAKFTKSFKSNLVDHLNDSFVSNGLSLVAQAEYYVTTNGEKNLIDIAITDQADETRLVGIEIEVYSSPDQIFTNKRKFKEWVSKSKYRKGGLLHLIFSRANITQKEMYRLLRESYISVAQGDDFYYEFMAIDPDYRESFETARRLVNESWEFDARIWALLYETFDLAV